MRTRVLLLIFSLPLIAYAGRAQPHHTTAFIGKPGTIDTLVSASTYCTDSFWNCQGERLPTFNHFTQQSFLLYAELAVPMRTSITFNGGFTRVRESLNGPSRGLDDIELGLKHEFYGTRYSAFTAQLTGIFPSGPKDSSIRYGSFGTMISLLYSQIFRIAHVYSWADFSLGYCWYKEFPSDRVDATIALGIVLKRNAWLILSNEMDYGFFRGDRDVITNNITLDPNYRLYKGKIEILFKLFSHTYISLGAYKHLWGRNVGTGGGYYGGIWLDF